MSDVEAAVWHIDPDTLSLAGGPKRPMTGDEWRRQNWPPCPVCGSDIDIDRIDVTSCGEPIPRKYMIGLWACPNECDPRRADPRWTNEL